MEEKRVGLIFIRLARGMTPAITEGINVRERRENKAIARQIDRGKKLASARVTPVLLCYLVELFRICLHKECTMLRNPFAFYDREM